MHQGLLELPLRIGNDSQRVDLRINTLDEPDELSLCSLRWNRHDDLLYISIVDLERAIGGLGSPQNLIVDNGMIPREDCKLRRDLCLGIGPKHNALGDVWVYAARGTLTYHPGFSDKVGVGISTHDQDVTAVDKELLRDGLSDTCVLQIVLVGKINATIANGSNAKRRGPRRLRGRVGGNPVLRVSGQEEFGRCK